VLGTTSEVVLVAEKPFVDSLNEGGGPGVKGRCDEAFRRPVLSAGLLVTVV